MDTNMAFDITIASSVCILYIVGKVWIYYKVETNNKETKVK